MQASNSEKVPSNSGTTGSFQNVIDADDPNFTLVLPGRAVSPRSPLVLHLVSYEIHELDLNSGFE